MSKNALSLTIIGALFALALLAGSVMVWQAAVASLEPTPAQRQCIELADGTFKVAVGRCWALPAGLGWRG